jgi:hypothetical protein
VSSTPAQPRRLTLDTRRGSLRDRGCAAPRVTLDTEYGVKGRRASACGSGDVTADGDVGRYREGDDAGTG